MKKIIYILTILLLGTHFTYSQWSQKGIDIDGELTLDNFGYSVSISSDGNTMAVGAQGNDGNGLGAGHVGIYVWSGGVWIQKGTDIDGEAAGDGSGHAIDLSADGNTVAIGAWQNGDNGTDAGHTRVYEWNGANWIQKGADLDGEATFDRSGESVSLSADGNTLAIGASSNDGNGANSGHTRIYEWSGAAWIQKGTDIDGEAAGDLSGNSVSLSLDGNTLAIGAYSNDDGGTDAGHTRVYIWTGAIWTQKGMDLDGEASGDRAGYSVDLNSDGNTLVVGAIQNDGNGSNSGQTRIYEWGGVSWTQKGGDIDGESSFDRSGYSVSLSSDGNTLATGAYGNDDNGSGAGHTRLYEWSGALWVQKGLDIDGEAAGDNSGFAVSLDSTGSTVAIGALYNDGNGSNAGHARAYEFALRPAACFSATPNPSACGQLVSFDATCSYHEDVTKTLVLYEWDFDNDGIYDAFGNTSSNAFSPNGTFSVRLRVTDNVGERDSTIVSVVINDLINPTASNLVTVTIECIGDIPAADITDVLDEADNCGVPVVAYVSDISDNNSCPETIIRTYSVTDNAANQITVTQTIIINDLTNPTASNPTIINVECIGDVPAPDVTVVTDETDNCTAVPIVTFVSDVSDNNSCPETITRTYSIADDCSNQILVTQLIIVNDITSPTASNPTTINVECIADVPFPDVTVVTDETDNCTAVPIVTFVSDVSDNNSCPETITRTYSITDNCSNQILVTQTIVVNDITSPIFDISTLTDITEECSSIPSTPTATDNCSGSIDGVPDVSFPITTVGPTLITWTYTDDCGNSSTQTQNVTITEIDNTTSLSGITLTANATGYQYQWVDCNNSNAPISGEINQNFTALINGNYAVEITDGTCTIISMCTQVATVGMMENTLFSKVSISPNPNNGLVNIDLGTLTDVSLIVYNLSGQVLYQKERINTSKYQFGLNSVAGVYFVELSSQGQRKLLKLIKQ
tara:strand:- start:61196 stop:64111 length:2916 start_codon:yes stop_codon:yes gene_type:complete